MSDISPEIARDRPRSRSRPEMKESRWRRRCHRAPRLAKNLDGVMIDISSRRPHRVHVRHLAPDRPRSPRSRSRLEMKDDWAAAALPARPAPRQSLDGVMIDISSRRPRRVHVRHLDPDRPRSPRSRSRLEMEDDWAAAALPSRPTPRQKPRRRDDRHQLTQTTSSPCPTSRSRSSEIAETAISSRDEGE